MAIIFFWACESPTENFDGSTSYPSSFNASTDLSTTNATLVQESTTVFGGSYSLDLDMSFIGGRAEFDSSDISFDGESAWSVAFSFRLQSGSRVEIFRILEAGTSNYIEIAATDNWSTDTGTLRLRFRNSNYGINAQTIGSTLSSDTWYTVLLEVDPVGEDYNFAIYNLSGTLIDSETESSSAMTDWESYPNDTGQDLDTVRFGDGGGANVDIFFDNIMIADDDSTIDTDWFDGSIDTYDDLSGGSTVLPIDLNCSTSIETPELGQEHSLDSSDLASASSVENPALGQAHDLSCPDLSSIPTCETPAIGQVHDLSGNDITSSTTLETPVCNSSSGTDDLAASDITSGTSVESPALETFVELAANGIVCQTASPDSTYAVPTLSPYSANGTVSGDTLYSASNGGGEGYCSAYFFDNDVVDSIEFSVADINQFYWLGSNVDGRVLMSLTDDSSWGNHVYPNYSIRLEYNGTFTVIEGFTSGTALASGTWTDADIFKIKKSGTTVRYYKNDNLIYTSLIAATFDLYIQAYLSGENTEVTDLIGGVEQAPSIGQEHALTANDIASVPVLDTPIISQVINLSANDLTVGTAVDLPGIGQAHILTVSDIGANTSVESPVLSESHYLTAPDLSCSTDFELAVLGQIHALVAADILAVTGFETPRVNWEQPDLIESHIYYMPFENRVYQVPARDPPYQVPYENRTITIK